MRISRRSFLHRAGAGVVATSLPACGRRRESADVVVIGAGLAGLNAARLLQQAGARVVTLEASTRAGGRVQTLNDMPGAPELGAADIGPVYSRVLATASRLGLTPEPWPAGVPGYWFNLRGQAFTMSEWPELDVNPFQGKLRAVSPSGVARSFMPRPNPLPDLDAWLADDFAEYDVPYGQFLEAQGAPAAALELALLGQQFDSLDQVSTLWSMRGSRVSLTSMEMAFAEGKPVRYYMPGGMSRLTSAMAASLNDSVRFEHRVTAIDQDASGASIDCENGARFRARFVVCCAPLPVVRQIAITPAPPPLMAQAIQEIPYGAATSVVLHVSEPYWEQDGLPPNMWTDLAIGRAFLNPSPIGEGQHLWVFTTGPVDLARRGWSDAEIGRFVISELNRLRPSTVGRVELSGVRAWTRDPHVLGTYASRAPGQIKKFGDIFARPADRLVFAGEHAAHRYAGMEGAMESAERAAGIVTAVL